MAATIVQQLTGSTNGSGSVTVTLPAGTTAGNRLIIAITAYFNLAPPAGLTADIAVNQTGLAHKTGLYSKATVGGETSWVFTQSGTDGGVWWAAEFSGLAESPLDKTASDVGANDTSIASGTTATTTDATEMALAAVGMYRATATTVPATVSGWTNSFVEVADVGNAAATARSMGVARRDLVATGAYSTVATANVTCHNCGIIATYKLAPPPGGTVQDRRRLRTLLAR